MSNDFRRLVLKHHFPQRKYKMSELPCSLSPVLEANEGMILPQLTNAPGHSY